VDQVLRVKRVNLADGEPFAVVTVWCPAELGAHLSRRDVERRPFYELLDVELHGATQSIGADLADVADARAARCPGRLTPYCAANEPPPTDTGTRGPA
jgi:GntR family transcriptional regulator